MPTLACIPLADIDEPSNPVRCEMDEDKMLELMQSIMTNGLLQPIGLKRNGARWEIEYGHRRFIAVTRLRLHDVLALCYEPGEIKEGAAKVAENAHREAVNAADEALMFAEDMERYKLDEAGMMTRFNVSADYLGDRMRLLRMGGKVFTALQKRQISFTVARELNKCEDIETREYYLDCAVRGGTGHRVVAQWIREWRSRIVPPSTDVTVLAPPTDAAADTSDALACVVCGGKKDPWNLTSVYIHKRELDDILRLIQQQAEAT
jgi:ParB/RepB/Spo0J family partition protein